MPARRPKPPGTVAASSLFSANDPGTDRVMKQVEQGLQDLQDKQRFDRSAIGTLQEQASGHLLAAPIRLTGTGSGTLPAGTCVVRLRGIGQGGGGGGGGSGAAGAGGSSGALLDIWIGTPGTPLASLAYSWTAGSGAGGGGNNTGTNGAAGADSTITINSTAYTMKGGGGGVGTPAAGVGTTTSAPASAVPAAGTSSGGIVTWGHGGSAFALSGTTGFSGSGGSTEMGAGGAGVASGAGPNGSAAGFGGGGAGGIGANAGGTGRAGGLEITPYS